MHNHVTTWYSVSIGSTLGNSDMSMFKDLRTPRYARFRRKCLFLLGNGTSPIEYPATQYIYPHFSTNLINLQGRKEARSHSCLYSSKPQATRLSHHKTQTIAENPLYRA
jgi:hypothetical protein